MRPTLIATATALGAWAAGTLVGQLEPALVMPVTVAIGFWGGAKWKDAILVPQLRTLNDGLRELQAALRAIRVPR